MPLASLPKFALAALLTATLAACTTVGPQFQTPAAPAGAYRHADAGQGDALQRDWWKIYGDPTLDDLQQRAQASSPTVQASAARVLQAQAQMAGIGAGRLPALNAGVSVANSRTSSTTSQAIALGGRSI
ncbi:MAG TPA: TolC family protein, partial [Burkholderiaceae bacterium]